MTKAELIKNLENYPDDMEVRYMDGTGEDIPITKIEFKKYQTYIEKSREWIKEKFILLI